jgi:polyribonucleotide nucleotidyltransferase
VKVSRAQALKAIEFAHAEINRLQAVVGELKASLVRSRLPSAEPLHRATVEDLMVELELRPREEVNAYVEKQQREAAQEALARGAQPSTGLDS